MDDVIEKYMRRILSNKKASNTLRAKIDLCDYLLEVFPTTYKTIMKRFILNWSIDPLFLPYALEYGSKLFGKEFEYDIENMLMKTNGFVPCITLEKCNRKFKNIHTACYHFCFVRR